MANIARPVSADEIRWNSDPTPPLEQKSVDYITALSPVDLAEYAYRLQRELQAVRALAHLSLDTIVTLGRQVERLNATIVRLHDARRQQRRAA